MVIVASASGGFEGAIVLYETALGLGIAVGPLAGGTLGEIAFGIVCGVNSTVTTQAVMTVSPVERPAASAASSFVRFVGGGLAPYAAGRVAAVVDIFLSISHSHNRAIQALKWSYQIER